MSYYDSVWDFRVWVWTLAAGGLVCFGLWILFRASKNAGLAIGAGSAILVVVVLALALAPRGYEIQGTTLKVRLVLATRTYDLTQIKEARTVSAKEVFPPGTWRVFGVGGLFGYYGYFKNAKLGRFLAFVTDRNSLVLLRFPEKTIVISPRNPQSFLEQVQLALK